jgi:hypothetical protein
MLPSQSGKITGSVGECSSLLQVASTGVPLQLRLTGTGFIRQELGRQIAPQSLRWTDPGTNQASAPKEKGLHTLTKALAKARVDSPRSLAVFWIRDYPG